MRNSDVLRVTKGQSLHSKRGRIDAYTVWYLMPRGNAHITTFIHTLVHTINSPETASG